MQFECDDFRGKLRNSCLWRILGTGWTKRSNAFPSPHIIEIATNVMRPTELIGNVVKRPKTKAQGPVWLTDGSIVRCNNGDEVIQPISFRRNRLITASVRTLVNSVNFNPIEKGNICLILLIISNDNDDIVPFKQPTKPSKLFRTVTRSSNQPTSIHTARIPFVPSSHPYHHTTALMVTLADNDRRPWLARSSVSDSRVSGMDVSRHHLHSPQHHTHPQPHNHSAAYLGWQRKRTMIVIIIVWSSCFWNGGQLIHRQWFTRKLLFRLAAVVACLAGRWCIWWCGCSGGGIRGLREKKRSYWWCFDELDGRSLGVRMVLVDLHQGLDQHPFAHVVGQKHKPLTRYFAAHPSFSEAMSRRSGWWWLQDGDG